MPFPLVKGHGGVAPEQRGEDQNEADAPDELHPGTGEGIDVGAESARGIEEVLEDVEAGRGIGRGDLEHGFAKRHLHLPAHPRDEHRGGPGKDRGEPNEDEEHGVLVTDEFGPLALEQEDEIEEQAEHDVDAGGQDEIEPASRFPGIDHHDHRESGDESDEHEENAEIS